MRVSARTQRKLTPSVMLRNYHLRLTAKLGEDDLKEERHEQL